MRTAMKMALIVAVFGLLLTSWPGVSAAETVTINDAYVYFVLDTSTGNITNLVWKGGSNGELLNQYWNFVHQEGPFRLANEWGSYGGYHETGSRLVNYVEGPNGITATFDNPDYGSKTLDIRWGATGLFVSCNFNLTRPDLFVGGLWQPGGDNWNDYLKIYPVAGSPYVFDFYYPGGYAHIYGGNDIAIGIADYRFNEMFGYKSDQAFHQEIAAGASLDGPRVSLPAGQSTVEFALTTLDGFDRFARPDPVTAIKAIQGAVMSLPDSAFRNANNRKALVNKLNAVIAEVEAGLKTDALEKLNDDILAKTDGCAAAGAPDRNDWITVCPGAQDQVDPLVRTAIRIVEGLLP